jgi:hypothetical protein
VQALHSTVTVKEGTLATLSKNAALRLAGILLFLLLSVILTFTGFYFSWRQVHSPDWTRGVAIVLLLPFAAVNQIFHWFTGPQPLSTPLYHAAFVISAMGQLLYYFTIFTLLRLLMRLVLRSPAREREGERQ